MTSVKILCLFLFCAFYISKSDAFFDGFDIFSQFHRGLDAHTRQQSHQLQQNLRTAFGDHVVRDVEPLGEDADMEDDVDPEQVEVLTMPKFPPLFKQGGWPGGLFNMFAQGSAGNKPWWKGANVCVDREEFDDSPSTTVAPLRDASTSTSASASASASTEEVEDGDAGGLFGSYEMSSCQQTDTRYVCTTKVRTHGIRKTFVVRYQCCHGYKRLRGKPGCSKVDLKSLLVTAEDLGAKDFAKLIKTSNLEEKLTADNLTLFVPDDDTLRDFMERMQRENQVEIFVPGSNARRRRDSQGRSMHDIALGHMTAGFAELTDLANEQVLRSEFDNSTLRINVYPLLETGSLVTCNCAKITSADNLAVNGVVHVVDKVLAPVTKTLAELVEQGEEFTTLLSMLVKADMMDSLKVPGHVTMFAPTNAAFKKLPDSVTSRLQDGHSCLSKVLQHHFLSHTLCSAAIVGHVSTYNRDGDVLHLRRTDDGKLFLEDAQIVTRDIVATNGVIHVIDDVIVPDSAKLLSEVLVSSNLTTFASLLRDAGLTESLDRMHNVTLLAPTDEALADPASRRTLDALKEDKEKLRATLLNHVIASEVASCDLANNLMLKTKVEPEIDIRINLYKSQPLFMGVRNRATAQCARIVAVDHKACGGTIHAVDRLIVAPTSSIFDIVLTDERFSTLKTIIQGTELEATLKTSDGITFLAPINDAFDDLTQKEINRLKQDKELASKVLKKHVLPEVLCCAGILPTSWPFTNSVATLSGDSITVRQDAEGDVHIGATTVQHCDLMATNGLIHAVNKIMVPRNQNNAGFQTSIFQRLANPNVEVLLYGL